ncbi:MAG TPA: TetR/AcrR family transcriptional regulator [Actinomycetota bacterium]|jgi:AcrR family transcriptional regulator
MNAKTTAKTGPHPHRTPLSRDRIVDAALRVMDDEGLEAVSMRRIGRELGVEAMSLYNHVEDKEDILDGICERVMSSFEYPEPGHDWEETVRRGARSWRTLLKNHPDVMRLLAEERGPVRSIDALRPMEFALRLFREVGLSDRDAAQTFHAFGGYIQGFVIMEMGSIAGGTTASHLQAHKEVTAELPEEFEALRAVDRYFAECSPDEQFEFGLDLLIRGVLERVRA